MKNQKFWKWTKNQADTERTLFLNGTIAEECWFDDDVTPQLFKNELFSGEGDITVWINSPGGDCVAAAQIYNMLMDYKGNVTIKIDGIAASAASVIAMAGTTVLMSPVSMLMIHNPMTLAMGDKSEMEKAIDMLEAVKDSIINAYELKTGLFRAKISHLMDEETWMDAHKAVELGFADAILERPSLKTELDGDTDEDDEVSEEEELPDEDETVPDEDEDTESEDKPDEDEDKDKKKNASSMLFSRKSFDAKMLKKLENHKSAKPQKTPVNGRSVTEILDRLDTIKNGKYRYFWLYRVKFGIPATNLATKGDSITFNTPTIEGTVMRRNKEDSKGNHPWKAEVTDGDAGVAATTITNWYKNVYEPSYNTT